MNYQQELLVTYKDDHISDEDTFKSLLKIRGVKINKNLITISDKTSNISLCKKDNDILGIKIIYIKLESEQKSDIEYISSQLCDILKNEKFKHGDYEVRAKIRILFCNASLENASMAYSCIYRVENLLRKFICLVCYPTEVMDWFQIYISKEIKNKISKRKSDNKEDHTDINIYDTDFGDALSALILQPPHEGLLKELREIVDNTKDKKKDDEKFSEIKNLIDDSYPKSLWDKKNLEKINSLKGFAMSWGMLEKHRNNIAHNKVISTEEMNKIKGLSDSLIEKIEKAIINFDLCPQEDNLQIEAEKHIHENIDDEIINNYEATNAIALSNFDEIEIDNLQYWFFNTNETYAPDAYTQMLKKDSQGVVAIYGYGSSAKFNGVKKGQKVLAYVNKKGILAVGIIINDMPINSTNIFEHFTDEVPEDEYSLEVKWEKILPEDEGLTLAEATMMGYPLPVRSTFCKLYNTELAEKLYNRVLDK